MPTWKAAKIKKYMKMAWRFQLCESRVDLQTSCLPQEGAQNKKNQRKKDEEKKCVIGHGRGQTEADRAEIGTELMEKHSGGQKNIAEPCRNRPKYTEMYKKSQKNREKKINKMLPPLGDELVSGPPSVPREHF